VTLAGVKGLARRAHHRHAGTVIAWIAEASACFWTRKSRRGLGRPREVGGAESVERSLLARWTQLNTVLVPWTSSDASTYPCPKLHSVSSFDSDILMLLGQASYGP
jgi:hypothetical protein